MATNENLTTQHAGKECQCVRIADALERLERRLDEFFDVYLNARFPHGRPTDRWRRSA